MVEPERVTRDRDERGRPRNARPRDGLGRPLPRGAADELGETPSTSSPEEAIVLGRDYFNRQRFFQAHEIWEEAWHAAAPEEREFWQGITQIAIGFCHFQRGNTKGAVTLLDRGARRLETCPDGQRGIPVRTLAAAARETAGAIRRDGTAAKLRFPSLPA